MINWANYSCDYLFELQEETESNCKICGCDIRESIHLQSKENNE